MYQDQGVNGEFAVPGGGLAIEVPVILEGREVARGTYRYTTEYQEREEKETQPFRFGFLLFYREKRC